MACRLSALLPSRIDGVSGGMKHPDHQSVIGQAPWVMTRRDREEDRKVQTQSHVFLPFYQTRAGHHLR